MKNKPTKQTYLAALYAFTAQRSGINYQDYGDRESFNGDYRPIIRHGAQARKMLRAIELRDSITAQNLIDAANSAFSGRLQFVEKGEKVGVDYCTGQYFATEYRKAVCAVCASVLWSYWRASGYSKGDAIRAQARKELGRAIASTWFN
jgi:hypothetical protein